jgi:beta-lactam-binding protein with PASTA domain
MKHILLTLLISIVSISISAQNLTMAQILEVKKKDLGNAEEYLTARGWEFSEAEEPSFSKFGSVTFTYNKSETSSRAESFFTYLFSSHSDVTRVSIQVIKKSKYTEYINAIKGFGCGLISSKVEDGNIVKVYRGKTTTFKVISGTSENFFNEETAIWHLIIFSNEDYDAVYGD